MYDLVNSLHLSVTYSLEDQVDGGGRGGDLEARGKGHSRTVSDVSFISTGSGSQGIGEPASLLKSLGENLSLSLSLSVFLSPFIQQLHRQPIDPMPVS